MVSIRNFTDFKISKDKIRKILEDVLEREGKKDFDLSLVFVPADKVRELSRTYKKKDRPTDVLSFGNGEGFVFCPENEKELGDVLICPEQVAINARSLNMDFKKEISRVAVHGVLHLLGYDHGKDRGEFLKKQEFYIDTLY